MTVQEIAIMNLNEKFEGRLEQLRRDYLDGLAEVSGPDLKADVRVGGRRLEGVRFWNMPLFGENLSGARVYAGRGTEYVWLTEDFGCFFTPDGAKAENVELVYP